MPSLILWAAVAAAGAATVLSFAILGEYYPQEISGRANAALNLLHVGGAFALQSATGSIVGLWPQTQGTYPAEAHHAAMATMLLLQLAALAWFAMPQRLSVPAMARAAGRSSLPPGARSAILTTPYAAAATASKEHLDLARRQVTSWRLAAAGSAMLCLGLAAALSTTISRPAFAVHILEANWSGRDLAGHAHSSDSLIEESRVMEGPPWQTSNLPSALMCPEPIVRPAPVMLAGSVSP
jgi:hypothetical protein